MSRFAFRLKRVLGVRRIEEDLARADWQDAERAARVLEAQALELQEAVERARAHLATLQSSPRLRAADVLLEQELIDRLREQCVQRTIQSSRARREAERLRQALAERRTRVRGLETLETRARETWRREDEARANAELDARAEATRAGSTLLPMDRDPRGTWTPS